MSLWQAKKSTMGLPKEKWMLLYLFIINLFLLHLLLKTILLWISNSMLCYYKNKLQSDIEPKIGQCFSKYCNHTAHFLSLLATVASNKRIICVTKWITSYFWSTEGQERLNGFTILNITSDKAKFLDFSDVIHEFSQRKAWTGVALDFMFLWQTRTYPN